MKLRLLYALLVIACVNGKVNAANYYVNAATGNDSNSGRTISSPLRSVNAVNSIRLNAGDSVLFATGQKFSGQLLLSDLRGTSSMPLVVASYRYGGTSARPLIDAGRELNAILVRNCSGVTISGLELSAEIPLRNTADAAAEELRCGIRVEITKDSTFSDICLRDLKIHDVYMMRKGFVRPSAEIKSANGTQSYGWGVRFLNNTERGLIKQIEVTGLEIFNVSHTGLKMTGRTDGMDGVIVANCRVRNTGGPGMQFSGVNNAHIHHNRIDHSGSTNDSRNWGRGSGLWTWGCSNFLIEHNRFENANGPGDSAGIHIDYNCRDVVVQYNFSANNAGGFCEILGNNFNCAYRYNISVNDGYREKGVNGAFQEGKIFWLSGYQGNQKNKAGPYNSYFYNNSIYVGANITPKIAVSSSSDGVFIANNIFYFENDAKSVVGDQKAGEKDLGQIPNVVFRNNLYLQAANWPADVLIHDAAPLIGNPGFKTKGGLEAADYTPLRQSIVKDRGIVIQPVPNDSIGLRVGLKVLVDILGNPVRGLPDLGAIESLENKTK